VRKEDRRPSAVRHCPACGQSGARITALLLRRFAPSGEAAQQILGFSLMSYMPAGPGLVVAWANGWGRILGLCLQHRANRISTAPDALKIGRPSVAMCRKFSRRRLSYPQPLRWFLWRKLGGIFQANCSPAQWLFAVMSVTAGRDSTFVSTLQARRQVNMGCSKGRQSSLRISSTIETGKLNLDDQLRITDDHSDYQAKALGKLNLTHR